MAFPAVRESQTFWISSEPPVKNNLAALMEGYGLSLREHLNYGRETKRKRAFGGLAAAVVLSDLKTNAVPAVRSLSTSAMR